MADFAVLTAGEPAPWFQQRTARNPRFSFDTTAGRYLLLCFFGSAGDPVGRAAIDAVLARRDLFDDDRAAFFGISVDPQDEAAQRVADTMPGIRYFWDFDLSVSRRYGCVARDAQPASSQGIRRFWMLIDPSLRIVHVEPFSRDGSCAGAVLDRLAALPPIDRFTGSPVHPPILVLPQVFDPALCERLVALFEATGGQESGFMREMDGKTVPVHDPAHKRRRDVTIEDADLMSTIQRRIRACVVPEIRKAHQFEVTRMERYIVSCYDAEDGGHFRAHRDNTTSGTAHRRFAVSVNLNEAFEGGEVGFPEYGPRTRKAPAGGAVVFSCSLLHRVTPVTSGRRYAFLPFLYDDAAARIRERNNSRLAEGVGAYRAAGSAAPAQD